MCTVLMESTNKKNRSFIISNFILTQTNDFTYDDILIQLMNEYTNLDNIEYELKESLKRLKENFLITEFCSKYSVKNSNYFKRCLIL